MEKEYWDAFYEREHTQEPTDFASFCTKFFNGKKTICDLGCGNGRDSLFFSRQGHEVIAVDQSEAALNWIASNGDNNIKTICADMSNINLKGIDVAYLRFVLHAINDDAQIKVLDWAKDALNPGGLLCIEVRSDRDFDNVEFVFGTDHFRRSLNFEKVKESLIKRGFKLEFSDEAKGYAVYGNEDPVVIRIIASK